MSNILGSVFLGASTGYAKAIVAAQLEVIKANNRPEFYEELLRSLDHSFNLLSMATKNKVVMTASQIFTEPIEAAAEASGIQL